MEGAGVSSLLILLVLGVWGVKNIEKEKPDTEESRPPKSLCQDSTPKVIYKVESPRMGKGFVTGAGLA